ncbi:MAG TPA: hypothetical protein VJH20_04040 [Candidatus Nanoarchaeia archaeon]|nr:hypothetical protein [Candidatus Nanoarchaeia archaeon]
MNYQPLFNRLKSNSLVLGLAGLLSTSMAGCEPNVPELHQQGRFRDFEVTVDIDWLGPRNIKLEDNTQSYRKTYLTASDRSEGSLPDGRFDEISLKYVPKGHILERYANLDSLELAYQTVMDKVNVDEVESRR